MNDRFSTSTYQEYLSGPELQDWVVCLWTLRVGRDGDGHVQRIVPDGCIDIVWIADQPPLLVGPMTYPVLYAVAAGTDVTGVRFRPGSAAGLLEMPADHLTDREVPLSEIWGGAAHRLTARIQETGSMAERFAAIRAELCSRYRACPPDRLLSSAIQVLAQRPGRDVRKVCEELGVTPRHLHRRFCAGLGYGPKAFQRIVRFQRLLHLAAAASKRSLALASLAVDAGYADQPHMTREVRRLAGGTPAELLFQTPSALAMSDLFKT